MKRILHWLFFSGLILFCLSDTCFAQLALGLQYKLSLPVEEYNTNLHKNPQGISITVLHRPKNSVRLMLGADAGVSMYAKEDYRVEIGEGERAGESFEVYEEDCFLSYNALARLILANHKWISPYVESNLGGVSFFSSRLAEDDYADFYSNKTTFHGTSVNLGLGLGVVINISTFFAIDLSFSGQRGTKTFYRSVAPADAALRRSLDYGREESATHHLNIKLGTIFGF